MTKLRLAIVGAGPAGIYAADILLKAERKFDVSIDLFEQLPAPYGLVRYGVAPDHPRIKGIITALRDVLDRGDIRLFGNVRFGEDITLDDLKKHYNAVIFATGAIRDTSLDIPGIDAVGSYGAADYVSWFDGHPDVPREWPLDAASVAVLGNGNVALDVSRMLAKHAEDLLVTEVPENVYEGLKASAVTDVHVFGRRGPAQVKFTPLELRELGELRDVDMVVYDEDFDYDEASKDAVASNKQVMVIDRILQSWRKRDSVNNAGGTASRRLHLHFWARPVEVRTDDNGRVAALVYERTSRTARVVRWAPGSCARCPCRRCTARSATSARRCPVSPSTRSTASSRTTRARCSRRTPTIACPACTRPAGSSAARSASSATRSPTPWRPSVTSSTTRARGGTRRTRPRRPSRHCSPSAASPGPTWTAGTAWTSTRSVSVRRGSARE